MNADFSTSLQTLSIVFVPFVMAIVFHEYAHGWMANKFGDTTAKDQGRLTLNPLPHIDWIGTIAIPIMIILLSSPIGFGWAKPVPISPERFTKYRKGLFWVASAGPLMNVLLAFLFGMALVMIHVFVSDTFYLKEPFVKMAESSVFLNFGLAFFNLIPLPPLDGAKIIQSFMDRDKAERYEALAQYSFFIIMALMMTGVFRVLSYPVVFFGSLTIQACATIIQTVVTATGMGAMLGTGL